MTHTDHRRSGDPSLDGGFEVITLGRVVVDLYPERAGAALEEAERFVRSLGGVGGVAIAASRLGRRCAVVSKVGDDAFGRYALAALAEAGVYPLWLGLDPDLRTPVTFHETCPIGASFPYGDYETPDSNLAMEELDLDAITAARLLWTTGEGLASDPGRSATLAALDARSSVEGGIAVHCLDGTSALWMSGEDARECNREALRHATVAVGDEDGFALVTGLRDAAESSEAVLDLGVSTVVIGRPSGGSFVRTATGTEEVPPSSALEAGDVGEVFGRPFGGAFGGALCASLVLGWEAARAARYAGAAGALAASRPTGLAPTLEEVESVVG